MLPWAGAFSLVRFRSVPGSAKEIGAIFLAMGIGLITGMGYLGFAVLFSLILCTIMLLYQLLGLGADKDGSVARILSITIPEDLNYSTVFDDIFKEYTHSAELTKVKTTNMGSMFRLTYAVILRDIAREKEMIDGIRQRNGNLEISISLPEISETQL